MKRSLILILLVSSSLLCYAQESKITNPDSVPKPQVVKDAILKNKDKSEAPIGTSKEDNKLSALVAYNFSGGNNKLTNLTPIINYGWSKDWGISKTAKQRKEAGISGEAKQNTITFAINPFVGGQIDTRDSSAYLPGLMLPGVAGVKIDFYWTFKKTDDGFRFIISPANFGFKLISNFADSTLTIAQHNFRSSIGFGYGELFLLSAQYTYGWHNGTSESEKGFKKAFGKSSTDIQYLNITLQTKLSDLFQKSPTFLYMEWRGLLNKKDFATFDNSRIVTIGIRSSIGFSFSTPAARPQL